MSDTFAQGLHAQLFTWFITQGATRVSPSLRLSLESVTANQSRLGYGRSKGLIHTVTGVCVCVCVCVCFGCDTAQFNECCVALTTQHQLDATIKRFSH